VVALAKNGLLNTGVCTKNRGKASLIEKEYREKKFGIDESSRGMKKSVRTYFRC